MFKMKIKTGGAAFSEDDELTMEGRYELSRILHRTANDIIDELDHGVIMDVNGNRVGEWELK